MANSNEPSSSSLPYLEDDIPDFSNLLLSEPSSSSLSCSDEYIPDLSDYLLSHEPSSSSHCYHDLPYSGHQPTPTTPPLNSSIHYSSFFLTFIWTGSSLVPRSSIYGVIGEPCNNNILDGLRLEPPPSHLSSPTTVRRTASVRSFLSDGSSSSSSSSDGIGCLHCWLVHGNIMKVAMTRDGSKILQEVLDLRMLSYISVIYSVIMMDDVCMLMMDPYGKNVFIKFVEVCGPEKRGWILDKLLDEANIAGRSSLLHICIHQNGSRSMLKLIECCCNTPEQILRLVSALTPSVIITLSMNDNGVGIVKHCLEFFLLLDNKCVVNAIIDNAVHISMNPHGCCVISQCLDQFCRADKIVLLDQITINALELSQDPFGNYVVQEALEKVEPGLTVGILKRLRGHYISLSLQKHSSHVVEKCLKHHLEERCLSRNRAREIEGIIQELCQSPNILEVMQNNYGNFVMKSALKVAKHIGRSLYRDVENVVMQHYRDLEHHLYGKHVVKELNEIRRCRQK